MQREKREKKNYGEIKFGLQERIGYKTKIVQIDVTCIPKLQFDACSIFHFNDTGKKVHTNRRIW